MSDKQKYEYKVLVTDKTMALQIEKTLNDYAKEGYRVVSSYNVKNGVSPAFEKILVILEREI